VSKERAVLQANMFSGEWNDNRTARQKRRDRERGRPQQIAMFAINDVVRLGESLRPWLRETPRGQLVLERVDIRTQEDVERDRRREAEALTAEMFDNTVTLDGEIEQTPETTAATNVNVPPQPDIIEPDCEHDKQTAYLTLVAAAHSWRFTSQLPQALLQAHRAGLTNAEIAAAVEVGILLDDGCGGELATPAASHEAGNSEKHHNRPIGYRARARQNRVSLRRRGGDV